MSKRADALTIRLARPEEREDLEALQRRASLANENDRPHLEAHPDAIHLPPAQIANELHIGDRTVESHLASTYSKLGIRSKGELIRMASTLEQQEPAPEG